MKILEKWALFQCIQFFPTFKWLDILNFESEMHLDYVINDGLFVYLGSFSASVHSLTTPNRR